MSDTGNPLRSALEDFMPIEEIELDTSISRHKFNGLLVDETLFLVCFYEGDGDIAIMADVSRKDYVVHYDEDEIDSCLECGSSEVSGISIIGSGLEEGNEDENVDFCDECFSEFKIELDEVVDANSDKVASNVL